MRSAASLAILWCAVLTGCARAPTADPTDAALAALLLGYLIGRIIHRRPRT